MYTSDEYILSNTEGATYEAARRKPFVKVDSDFKIGPFSEVVLVDASGGTVTIDTPDVLSTKGKVFTVKMISTSGTVNITGLGPEFPVTLTGSDYPSITILSDGEQFFIL